MIDCERGVFPVMAQDNGGAVATGDVDPPGGTDGRRKDEIVDAIKPEWLASRVAGHGVEPRKHVLIVPQDIERVVIEQRRGDVRR